MPEVTNADLMDMMASDNSPSGISDRIKDILFNKSAEKIDDIKPNVAANMFDQGEPEEEVPDTADSVEPVEET